MIKSIYREEMEEPLGSGEKWSVHNTTAALVRAGNILRSIGTSAEILSKPRVWTGKAVMPTLDDVKTYGDHDYVLYPLEPVEGSVSGRMSNATLNNFMNAESDCEKERRVIKRREEKVIAALLDSLAPDMWDSIANVDNNLVILASYDLHQIWPLLITASGAERVNKALRSLTDLCSLRMAPGQFAPFVKQFRELLRQFAINFESEVHPGYISMSTFTSALFLQHVDQDAFKNKLDQTKASLKGTGLHGLPDTETLMLDYQQINNKYFDEQRTKPQTHNNPW